MDNKITSAQIIKLGNRDARFKAPPFSAYIVAAEDFPFTEEDEFIGMGDETRPQSAYAYLYAAICIFRSVAMFMEQSVHAPLFAGIDRKNMNRKLFCIPITQLFPKFFGMAAEVFDRTGAHTEISLGTVIAKGHLT